MNILAQSHDFIQSSSGDSEDSPLPLTPCEVVLESSDVAQEPVEKINNLKIDSDAAYSHIEALTGSRDSLVTFQVFPERDEDKEDPDRKNALTATWTSDLRTALPKLERYNNDFAGIYVTVQKTDGKGRKTINIKEVRALIVDFDGKLPSGSEWHLQPSIITRTSNGRGHAYYRLKDALAPCPLLFRQWSERLIGHYDAFGADPSIKDLPRVLRLAGTYNVKGEPTKATVEYIGSERYTVDEILIGVMSHEDALALTAAKKAIKDAEAKAVKDAKAPKAAGSPKPVLLTSEIAKAKKDAKAAGSPKRKGESTHSVPYGKNNRDYTQMLAKYTRELAAMGEASGRNSVLNTSTHTLVGLFPQMVTEIKAEMYKAAVESGLEIPEIEATLASAIKAGLEKPIELTGKGIDWTSEHLTSTEKDLIEYLHPLHIEYQPTIDRAREIGNRVLTPRSATETENNVEALKLAALIRYSRMNSLQMDRNTFVFDTWASYSLTDYRINSATTEVELKGEVVSLDDLFTDSFTPYRKALGFCQAPRSEFITMVLTALKDRKSNPWVDAMKALTPINPQRFIAVHGFDPHQMAEFITGDAGELAQKLWMYQFIGSMDRTFNPGCRHDHMLILISPEKGLRKTTFLQTIAKVPTESEYSSKYYLQLRLLKSDKVCTEKMRGKMIVNLDECDSAFRGLNADELKESITATHDNYRAAYASTAKDHVRICTLFGTTNTTELLQDLSGDRRFFPIRVTKSIDIEWLKANWADFWGFYLWAYEQHKAGNATYRHHLIKAEEELLTRLQCRFKAIAPWLETLEGMLEIIDNVHPNVAVKISDILATLAKETGSVKAHMAESAKALMISEHGYKEGRPKLSDGRQPGKPILFKKTTDGEIRLLSRMEIAGTYENLINGSYLSNK